MKYLSALLPRAPSGQSAPSVDEHAGDDFLMLDNDVSISRDRIEIGTVLYDRRSSPTRANSWLTRLFSFVKRIKALKWVSTFVDTRLRHLPGSESFIAHIRKQWGVRRDEFVDFLIAQRLNGVSFEKLAGLPLKEASLDGEHQIKDVEKVIMNRLSASFGEAIRQEYTQAFLLFVDSRPPHIAEGKRDDVQRFIEGFQKFAVENTHHPLVGIIQGKVNFLKKVLHDDHVLSEACGRLRTEIATSNSDFRKTSRSILNWDQFRAFIEDPLAAEMDFHESCSEAAVLDFTTAYLQATTTSDLTEKGVLERESIRAIHDRLMRLTSRRMLMENSDAIHTAIAKRFERLKHLPADSPDKKAIEEFFRVYIKGGACSLSPQSIVCLGSMKEEHLIDFFKRDLRGSGSKHGGAELLSHAKLLFSRMKADLMAISGSSDQLLDAPSLDTSAQRRGSATPADPRERLKGKLAIFDDGSTWRIRQLSPDSDSDSEDDTHPT